MGTASAHHWLKWSGVMLPIGAVGFTVMVAGGIGISEPIPGPALVFRYFGLLVCVGAAAAGFVFAARAHLQECSLGVGGLAALLMVLYGLLLFFIALGVYVTLFVARGD